MRARPRTWPSIRFSRFAQDALMSLRMAVIYPQRVSVAIPVEDPFMASEGVRDPVCGMTVDPHKTPHRHSHAGSTYYFCSAGCRDKFSADPAKYLAPQAAKPPAPAGAIYTCPMHPQIKQVGPGVCPICGMALEPEVATAEAAPNPELADMTRRFWIAVALALPVVIIEMGG